MSYAVNSSLQSVNWAGLVSVIGQATSADWNSVFGMRLSRFNGSSPTQLTVASFGVLPIIATSTAGAIGTEYLLGLPRAS
jgi:hypothetical protein